MTLRFESSCGAPRRLFVVAAVLAAVIALSQPVSAATRTGSPSPPTVPGDPMADAVPVSPPPPTAPGDPMAEPVPGDPMAEPVPGDPMDSEEPGEDAPATDMTVPPKETYGGQDPFEPAEILWSNVATAERKLADARTAKEAVIVEVRQLRKRGKQLSHDQQQLGRDKRDTLDDLEAAGDRLASRAVLGYQRFGSGSDPIVPPDVADYQEVVDSQRKSKMIGSALDIGESDLERLDRLRAELDGNALTLLERSRVVADYLYEVTSRIVELDEAIEQSAIEYEAFRAGSEVFIHGVVFPIAGSYPTPLIDSFGFPRMTGTPDEHWHEGIDLFADRGTPLVATERGVVTKVGTGRLGGLKFWLKGESGSEWYYAHLDSFAPGLTDGLVVEAGQLVGYVGTTGNAVGTPPHVHMQLHPDGGRPVNPYPLLKVVSDLDRARIEAGTHPGYEYQPHVVDRPDPVPVEEPVATIDQQSG